MDYRRRRQEIADIAFNYRQLIDFEISWKIKKKKLLIIIIIIQVERLYPK